MLHLNFAHVLVFISMSETILSLTLPKGNLTSVTNSKSQTVSTNDNSPSTIILKPDYYTYPEKPSMEYPQTYPSPQYEPYMEKLKVENLTLLNGKIDPNKTVSGIVVTLKYDHSYDPLFTQEEQQSKQGTQVLVYAGPSSDLPLLNQALSGNFSNNIFRELFEQIKVLERDCPNCIVFNWQCSSGYGRDFPEGNALLFQFLGKILRKEYVAMFSDFSLKSLIQQWNATAIGPNPFIQIGDTSSPIDLKFNSSALKQSPSAQLQIVGELAQNGEVLVDVMAATIVYIVNPNREATDLYELKTLTTASNFNASSFGYRHFGYRQYSNDGTAGHVLLSYRLGGHILTSMSHWIELLKINTSKERLFEVAQSKFGEAYAANLQKQYDSLGEDQKEQSKFISQNAQKFVYQQSPGQNNAYK